MVSFLTCSAEAYFATEGLKPKDYVLRPVEIFSASSIETRDEGRLNSSISIRETNTSLALEKIANNLDLGGPIAITDFRKQVALGPGEEDGRNVTLLYLGMQGTAIIKRKKK